MDASRSTRALPGGRSTALVALLAGGLLLSACGAGAGSDGAATVGAPGSAAATVGTPEDVASARPDGDPTTTDHAARADEDLPTPQASVVPAPPTTPITLAFGGDTHTAGSAGVIATDGLGPIAETLRAADVAVVNLETAIVTSPGAEPAPKQYTFATDPGTLSTLAADGVDVLSMANNHGLDFGRQGLDDTLAAAEAATDVAVVGIGADLPAALAPHIAEVGGRTVGVMAATDVLDSFALELWPATATSPGMASSKGDAEADVLAAVRALDAAVDVAVVVMHWGVEREVCPTQRQRQLADALLAAGADVVVGSHAHVVQPVDQLDGRTVAYGLGNFGWYTDRSPSNRSGVLTVTIDPAGVQSTAWQPATISGGRPLPDGDVVPVPDLSAAGCATT